MSAQIPKVMDSRNDFIEEICSEYGYRVVQVTGGAGFMDSRITWYFMVV